MEPKIVTVDKFMVAGLSYVGKNEHGEMWGEFNKRWHEVKNVVERPAAASTNPIAAPTCRSTGGSSTACKKTTRPGSCSGH
jgi:predicted transcriptional regulator YdeE